MNCIHERHPLDTSPPVLGPHGGLRYVDTCRRCSATRTRDIAANMDVRVGRWRQPPTLRSR